MKVVIIGGVAGGMSAATRLRRLDEHAEIIVLEKGPYVSFANCGLPYHVSEEIEKRQSLLVQTPEQLRARFQLDVRPNSEAIKIDTEEKLVIVRSGDEIYTLDYDKLILSPGAKPFIPPINGLSEAKNVFTLRNINDMDKILAFIDESKPETAMVIGAGFIGLEMAESLAHRGLQVSIVERSKHVLSPFDEEMAAFVAEELKANGVNVLTSSSVVEFKDDGRTAILGDGSALEADLVILSVGVQPENALAIEAGVEIGARGGILVDENYETTIKDIFAVGDAILVKHIITKEEVLISLASPANRQGRQVADVISGLSRKNLGSLGTSIVRVFGKAAASTGLNERQLKMANLDYKCVHVQGKNHAGYFPNSKPIVLKLLFNSKTGDIYGAQAFGEDGIDKRIDILSTVIKAGLKVEDLPELEFTYAPPFGSAKDIVNMAGYAALNIIEGLTDTIQWYELIEKQAEGAFLLDVRTANEFNRGAMKGATNIPLDDLRIRLNELPENKDIIVSCQSGQRSYIAERILKQAGYIVSNLDGSFALYSTVRPTEVIKNVSIYCNA
ncbi:MAG: CoA-disulfide reductase [Bacillales bacterium]|jgi:NADPH-dependent 2,4-dienoyl-CoA reductase/sulfur reductase-like enzyme/rhodanese-related sulfurtransferase|nr:CoA-disulfide reductase [Bacillales bacterium]